MVYRKSLDSPWICSWNCGFKDWNIEKVIEHENKREYQHWRIFHKSLIHHPACATRPQKHQNHSHLHATSHFEDDEFLCKTASNIKEATELIDAGYQYVCEL